MSVAPKPVSSASSRSAPSGDALAGLERAGHALPQPRQDPAGRAAQQQDLGTGDAARRPAHPEHPAVDEVRAEGAHARHDGVQLVEVHQVVDAGEDQPLPAAQLADQRMVQRARIRLVPGHGPGRPFHDPLALGDLAQERRRGRRRPGPGRRGRSAARRPASDRAAALAAASARPARASQSCPIAWATFQSSSPPSRRRSSSDRPRRRPPAPPRATRAAATMRSAVPVAGQPPDLPADLADLPVSMPRHAATRSGARAPARRPRSVIGGRWPSSWRRVGCAAGPSRRSRRPARGRGRSTRGASHPHPSGPAARRPGS